MGDGWYTHAADAGTASHWGPWPLPPVPPTPSGYRRKAYGKFALSGSPTSEMNVPKTGVGAFALGMVGDATLGLSRDAIGGFALAGIATASYPQDAIAYGEFALAGLATCQYALSQYTDGAGNHGLLKSGTASSEATKQLAFDVAQTNAVAATATASSETTVSAWSTYYQSGNYRCAKSFRRMFYKLEVPPGGVLLKIRFLNHNNSYWTAISTETVQPTWSASVYVGTTDPALLGSEDWDYGELGCTVECPATLTAPPASGWVTINNLVLGQTNYLQVRSDESVMQCVVDSGYWGGSGRTAVRTVYNFEIEQ